MKKVFRLVSFFTFTQLWAGVASAQQTSASSPPQWAREAIWYQIFTERFRNGDPSNDPLLDIPSWKIKDWGGDYYKMDTWEALNGNIFQTIQDRRYGVAMFEMKILLLAS